MDPVATHLSEYFQAHRPPGVTAVYLFGSHVRGHAHAGSDVDVGVVHNPGQAASRAARSRLALSLATDLIAATHRNSVDVVVLNDASPELSAAVVTEGRRVYVADPDADHDFRRTVQLRRADLRPFLERTRQTKLQAILR